MNFSDVDEDLAVRRGVANLDLAGIPWGEIELVVFRYPEEEAALFIIGLGEEERRGQQRG